MRKRNRRKGKRKNTFLSGIISLLLVIICSCFFGSFFSSAHDDKSSEESSTKVKYYTSIEIKKGDSLWKIAEDHITNEYESINEYIEELISINHIDMTSSDMIQEGDYLTIAYYE